MQLSIRSTVSVIGKAADEAAADGKNTTDSSEETPADDATKGDADAATDDGKNATDTETKNATEVDSDKPVCKMKTQKRVHRRALKVTQEEGGLKPMSVTQKKESKRTLRAFEERERIVRERAAAMNDLESYVYNTRDKMENDDFKAVTTEEQRTELETALSGASTWLDDEGFEADTPEFVKRLRELKDMADPAFFRIREVEARPIAVSQGRSNWNTTTHLLATTRKEKSWLTDDNVTEVENALAKFDKWLTEVTAEQDEKKAHEAPAFQSSDVEYKFEPVVAAYKKLLRMPKPVAPKVKKVKTKANATNATDSNTTEATASDEAAKSEESEAKSEESEAKSEESEAKSESDAPKTSEQDSEEGEEASASASFGEEAGEDKSEL